MMVLFSRFRSVLSGPLVWFCQIFSLVSVMGTPSGQYQHPVCKSWIGPTCSSHPVRLFFLFFSTSVCSSCCFFLFSPITFYASGYLLFSVKLEDSSWTDRHALFSPSFSLFLEGFKAVGASEAQERSLGKKKQKAVRLQPSPLHNFSLSLSLHPFFPPLVPLYSLSSLASTPN